MDAFHEDRRQACARVACVSKQCPNAFAEADPADREEHRAVRLLQSGLDRRYATRSSPAMAAWRPPSTSASTPYPTCRLSHLSEADKRAYILADNKLAQKAGWDRELLAIELQGLIELEVDIELTGFEMPEIDVMLEEAREASRRPQRPGRPRAGTSTRPSGHPKRRFVGARGTIAYCAAMPATRPPTTACWKAPRRSSSFPTRRTMLRLTAMSAASVAFTIASSRWAAAR